MLVAEYFLVVYFLGRLLNVRFTGPFVSPVLDLKTPSEEDFSISLQVSLLFGKMVLLGSFVEPYWEFTKKLLGFDEIGFGMNIYCENSG